VQMEHRLPRPLAHVDEHAVVVEPRIAGRLGDEVEHPLRLLGRELAHLAEARHVSLGQDEQVHVRLGGDVADGHEPVALAHVVALAHEPAEETVAVRQRALPPP
jgi:hypothetical protein